MLIYAGIALVGFVFLLIMLFLGDLFGPDHDLVGHEVAGDFGGPSVLQLTDHGCIRHRFWRRWGRRSLLRLVAPGCVGVGIASGALMAGLVYQFAKIWTRSRPRANSR